MDSSGALNREELAGVVQTLYRNEKQFPTLAVVQSQVDSCMEEFDNDGSGVLEFAEFAGMVCKGAAFDFLLSDEEKQQVCSE